MKYLVTILSIALIVLSIILVIQIKKNQKLEMDNTFKEKEYIKKTRDSILNIIENNTNAYKDSLNQLKAQKNEIKYIKFEKKIYVDRTFFDALLILSNYRYDSTRARTSQ